jgi:hypothetical protein
MGQAQGVSDLDRHGVARRWCLRGAKEGMLECRRRSLSSWKEVGLQVESLKECGWSRCRWAASADGK